MKPYYEHDGITIWHGEFEKWREMGASLREVTTVHADPMYGIGANTSTAKSKRSKRMTPKGFVDAEQDWGLVASDKTQFDPSWFVLTFEEVVMWGANHYADMLPPSASWFVWDKRCGGTSDDGSDCELAWTNFVGPARLRSHLWRGLIRAGEENAVNGPKLHPFQKPTAIIRYLLERSQTKGTILVPFGGSAPEVVIARELGRKCIVFEIEERFCEIAAKRLAQEVLF